MKDDKKKFDLLQRKAVLRDIPEKGPRQDSTTAQLRDLVAVAQKLGMYDAADFLKSELES